MKNLKLDLKKFSLKKLLGDFDYNYHNDIFIKSLNKIETYRWETIKTKEPETIEWINNIDKESIFIDIGSNIGIFTIAAVAKGIKQIISIEPYRKNFITLCRNLEENHIKNVAAFNIGISDSSEFVCFSGSNLESGGAEFTYEKSNLFNINTTLFNNFNFIEKYLNDKPLYIKIDVDGGEINALNGIKNLLLRSNTKSLLIESSANNTQEKINLIMKKYGFEIDKYYEEFRPHSIVRRIKENNIARNNVYSKSK